MGLLRQLPGILVPLALAMAVVAVGLRVLNATPAYVQALVAAPPPAPNVLDERLSFPSIEAAEKELGVRVATPAYFPSYLSWPPSSIRAQREPVKVVSLLFRSSEGQQGLQIRELFWQGETLPFPVPEPLDIAQRKVVDVNGTAGQLLLGSGQGGTTVNQLRWRVGGIHFILTAVFPPEELLRIAESIEPQ